MKYIVFIESELKGRIQLFRYGLSCLLTSALNWVLLKAFVELLFFYPSLANIASSCIVVLLSYLIQRNFTFKNDAIKKQHINDSTQKLCL